jgi:hypothetical protein
VSSVLPTPAGDQIQAAAVHCQPGHVGHRPRHLAGDTNANTIQGLPDSFQEIANGSILGIPTC